MRYTRGNGNNSARMDGRAAGICHVEHILDIAVSICFPDNLLDSLSNEFFMKSCSI